MPDSNPDSCSCPKHAPPEPKRCPQCGHELDVLLFMDVQPEGYVCTPCGRLYGLTDLVPGARVI